MEKVKGGLNIQTAPDKFLYLKELNVTNHD